MSRRRKNKSLKDETIIHDKRYIINKNRKEIARSRINRVFNDYLEVKKLDYPYYFAYPKERAKIQRDFLKEHRLRINSLREHLILQRAYSAGDEERTKAIVDVQKRVKAESKLLHRLDVCLKRQTRRESLFAFARIGKGKGSQKRRHHWTKDSKTIKC